MEADLQLPYNWEPRASQAKAWHALETAKRALIVAHRRWGKDEIALHHAACQAMKRPAVYWHMLPQQNQARRAIWTAINPHTGKRRIDEAFPKEIRERTLENEMAIHFVNGSVWQVVGSDNYDALVGAPPAGIVFSEYALANPLSWSYLRPILEENGGWAVFITTPRGKNHVYKMYEGYRDDQAWFVQHLAASETGAFTPDQLARIRREYQVDNGVDLGNALFDQEYQCSWEAAMPGAYYAAEMAHMYAEKRICRNLYDKGLPVYTAWDLGVGDMNAITFYQVYGKERRIIDFHGDSGKGLDEYAKVLREKPYQYAKHYLPHDGKSREKVFAITPEHYLRSAGIGPIEVVPRGNVDNGIQAVRKMLAHTWMDEDNCEYLIEALKAYRREWDSERKVFKPNALHDWSSHPADSVRTMAVGHRDARPVNIERRVRARA